MECVINPQINCKKGQACPSGYECCSQIPENGSSPTFGLCVKENNCDKKRGIPKKGCKDERTKPKYSMDMGYENFIVSHREGYDDDTNDTSNTNDTCTNWKRAFLVLIVLIFVLIFACTVIFLNYKK